MQVCSEVVCRKSTATSHSSIDTYLWILTQQKYTKIHLLLSSLPPGPRSIKLRSFQTCFYTSSIHIFLYSHHIISKALLNLVWWQNEENTHLIFGRQIFQPCSDKHTDWAHNSSRMFRTPVGSWKYIVLHDVKNNFVSSTWFVPAWTCPALWTLPAASLTAWLPCQHPGDIVM